MQNIRKDMTSSHGVDKSNTWEEQTLRNSAMTDIDIQKQEELLEFWKNASNNLHLKPSEIAELELQRRISAATEGDTSAHRTDQRIKEHNAEVRLDKWARGQVSEGQSEEEFLAEMHGKSEKYSDAIARARKASGL